MTVATLAGLLVTRATVVVPRWGIWWADVQAPSDAQLSGRVELKIEDLTLSGTIAHGGPFRSMGWYRIVGGAGGWRSQIPERAYRAEVGVKLSTVLRDAASACGETLGTVEERRVGPAYVRLAGDASSVLEALATEAWHVDAAGVTQIGLRAPTAYAPSYRLIAKRPDRALITIAPDSLATLVPGAQLEGLEAYSVRIELSPTELRAHIWGELVSPGDRLIGAMRSMIELFTARTAYHAPYEYRVISSSNGYCDLRPVRSAKGLPDLSNVPMRAGVPGGGGEPMVGSTAHVSFSDGDPTRPFVCGFDGESASGWTPTVAKLSGDEVRLGDAQGYVLRDGELVSLTGTFPSPGPGTGVFTVTLGPGMINPGEPNLGRSKVLA